MPRARYSRWDGSQEADELDADDVFGRLCDDLAQHGDLDQALRRVMQHGFLGSSGRQVAGLRELLERVRQRRAELTRDAFSQLQAAISAVPPEALQRAREMLADLNSLVERQRAGEDVQADFEQFRDRYADLLPGDPSTLDELLETLASQMAAMRELLGSMTPEQRAKLAELSEAVLEAHPGLSSELERLASNLAGGALAEGASSAGNPTGVVLPPGLIGASGLPGPFGTEATSFVGQVTDLGQLEQLLSAAPNPGALAEVDIERARELLGAEDARSLEILGRLGRELRRAGLAEQKEGRLRLTPRGLRRIGEQALNELYTRLARSRAGQHAVERQGPGHERAGETKPYEWGDPFNLSIERTLRNAVARRGPGLPVELSPEDFDVERTEALSRSATVIMLDLSLSMPMRGNFLAAKKVAMALHALDFEQVPLRLPGCRGLLALCARNLLPCAPGSLMGL